MAGREQVLTAQYIAGQRQLRSAWLEFVRRWFAASQSFRDADAERYVAQVVPVALGAQQSMASLTWAYLTRMLAEVFGGTPQGAPLSIGSVSGTALRGVDPQVVYRRPFSTIYAELAKEQTLTEAVTAGERRAKLIGLTDLQLAKTHATRAVYAGHERVQYFRREFTGDENCGLCIVASTQRYHKGDLMPIHPGCDCVPVPIDAQTDPGQVLDRELLDAAHAAIRERFGIADAGGRAPDYRKILLVRQHGELGPVLTVAGHKFTSADDIPSLAG